jgi:AcrR family transcriptional regulator
MTHVSTRRKNQIYVVAERLFSERGYHATTVRDIARELQIEGGSLYTHISGKQHLLYDIVLRASEQFLLLGREVTGSGGTAREQLRMFMQRHLAIIAASTDRAAVYFHEWRHLNAAQQATITAHRDEYEGYLRQIVRRGMAGGEFAAGDERLVSVHILSLLNWTYQWYRADGALNASELADRFFEQVMCGLEPRHGEQRSAGTEEQGNCHPVIVPSCHEGESDL